MRTYKGIKINELTDEQLDAALGYTTAWLTANKNSVDDYYKEYVGDSRWAIKYLYIEHAETHQDIINERDRRKLPKRDSLEERVAKLEADLARIRLEESQRTATLQREWERFVKEYKNG